MTKEFIEMWEREDGELGNGWIDAYYENPKWWDQFKLVNGVPVTINPDRGLICQNYCSGARAAFYREFGPDFKSNFAASVVWCGVRPYEGTPLIHVNPEDDDFGIGAWYLSIISTMLIGFVGRSPDKLRIIDTVPVDHISGLKRRIEIRSTGDEFSVWISKTDIRDDAMMKVGRTYKIPAGLIGATKHGAALDINQDYNRPANVPILLPPYRIYKMEGNIHEENIERNPRGVGLDGKLGSI
ncbi:MAG TPA: hypothetical protein GXX14_08995 [Clostridiaceae bacterium]|nr:hypothetical protein [Clostridiaceae bacterium]